MSSPLLRIGSRGSPLALAQAREVRRKLAEAHHMSEDPFEIVVIRTSGDMIQDRPLAESGGKGLFTKEIDQAQLDGAIDIAVHSAKDLPTVLPEGLALSGFLEREDVRDALIAPQARTFDNLRRGAVVGTASLRRAAQIRRLRPDIETVLLRGNVETRLRKAESGEIDATLLALAGLKRLGLAERATSLLDTRDFLPAVGQGAIAVAVRAEDYQTHVMIGALIHHDTSVALAAERAFLRQLDGSCRTPIAGHATVAGPGLSFRGQVLRADGGQSFEEAMEGPITIAASIGAAVGVRLLAALPPGVLPTSRM